MKLIKKIWWLIIIVIAVFLFWYFKIAKHYPTIMNLQAKENYWGVTYSLKQAKDLGLDWKQSFSDILDDLQVKNIRLPIYWDDIEKNKGSYDFGEYDYLISEGDKRGVNFTANIGWRLPRWPECHRPAWLAPHDQAQIQKQALLMLEQTVNHYKEQKSISAWQVENEPLLNSFGECPPADLSFLQKEVALVRSLDPSRPIIITGSGELSDWQVEGKVGDIFGTTMYRVVWSKLLGYIRYPWPVQYYQLKAKQAGLSRDKAIISELQAEPWVPQGSIADISKKEADKSFNINQFRANLQYAIDVDFKQTYLWGVEWWYLQKLRGNSEYWDLARQMFTGK